ncbi:MAG: hypothetical protein JW703_03995 [Candidatus Diapherotrites archaeon]|nr:hypothetical protein [Candidatus Diapherotrites archaeon]
MNEFVLLKDVPEKKESVLYGKIASFNSDNAVAELNLKDSKLKLVFSSKSQLKKIKAGENARVIGTLIYNNNEPIFNVKTISLIESFDLNLLLKIIELEKKVLLNEA